jgi:YtkA-like
LRTVELILALALAAAAACSRADDTNMIELQRLTSGALDVVLLPRNEAIRHGKDTFIIEFRSTSGGQLIDVGNVRVSANMPMPGMVMFGKLDVVRTDVPGRYTANSDFGMAGTWRIKVEWDGPAGRGAVDFAGSVQ